jgi:dihydroflavonol-4-reductase
VGTIGLAAVPRGQPATETDYPDLRHRFGPYKRSKYVAEHEVLRAAAEGLPVSLVQPTMPFGPGDRAPTPSGRLVVDFLNGRMPGYVDTVLNVVHVDDVAGGHLLAHDRGAAGRTYILGGENLSLQQILAELASITGLPTPRLRVPHAAVLAAAILSDIVEGRLLRRPPHIPLEAARMSTTLMAFDDSRARSELGYAPRPARAALSDSMRWFVDAGYVTSGRRLAAIRSSDAY